MIEMIGPESFVEKPWKNGQGKTLELAVETQEGSEAWNWRLSMARVEADGPFSDFSGYERHLMLIEGRGLDLRHEHHADQILIQPFEHVVFGGDWQTSARLVSGPITDFNVMTRIGTCSAQLLAARAGNLPNLAEINFLYAPKKETTLICEAGTFVIFPKHLLKFSRQTSARIEGGPAVLVCISC
ncbi:MAG: HutD family protein [Acidobacteria bacterium]|nr:HutD family protein [Acidobacteriota bacterium]MCB9399095.1 HutD family protein [Acidobacteriota bacterium]